MEYHHHSAQEMASTIEGPDRGVLEKAGSFWAVYEPLLIHFDRERAWDHRMSVGEATAGHVVTLGDVPRWDALIFEYNQGIT